MTQLVGVINVTPDSFSDGGLFLDPAQAVAQAERLFADGAALVDIGAESTRPGAEPITPTAEWQRLEPVLHALLPRFVGKLSVDTHHPETAKKVLALGDIIINDVSGLSNPAMIDVVLKHHARVIISHLPGANIQAAHRGKLVDNVVQVTRELLRKADQLERAGLDQSKIILDPGIGFGKTPELNRQLLSFAEQVPDYPVMIGYSRKRFLGEQRMELEPNLAAGRVAIMSGAAYLRVHDVAGHRQLVSSN